jgi:hypothetical protein
MRQALLACGSLLLAAACSDPHEAACREEAGGYSWSDRGREGVPITDVWAYVDTDGTLFARATRDDGSVAAFDRPGRYVSSPLAASPLVAVSGDRTGTALAITDSGMTYLVDLVNSTGWVDGPRLQTPSTLRDVSADADGVWWAVGSGGLVAQLDRQTWAVAPTVEADLLGVSASSGAVWLVSADAVFRGSALDAMDKVDVQVDGLRAIAALSADRAWVVGDAGALLEWNGSTFAKIETGTRVNLTAVWADPDAGVWAVGEHGTILHVPPGASAAELESLPSIDRDHHFTSIAGARQPRLAGVGPGPASSVVLSAGTQEGSLLSRQETTGTVCR